MLYSILYFTINMRTLAHMESKVDAMTLCANIIAQKDSFENRFIYHSMSDVQLMHNPSFVWRERL